MLRTKSSHFRIDAIAGVLNKSCDTKTIAAVIYGLLCCDANEKLSDRESAIGEKLFDELTKLNPEATDITQGLVPEVCDRCGRGEVARGQSCAFCGDVREI